MKLTRTPEEKKRDRLRDSIARKREMLEEIMEKVEMLRMELDAIKKEYDVRIGMLLLKDNQLDLEILKFKNLQSLMENGMTYAQAVKHEEDKFYNEILKMQKERERIEEEEKEVAAIKEVTVEEKTAIRDLWKKLIRKFHPDLTTDKEKKKEHEEITKKINKAYTENDYDALVFFTNNQQIEEFKESSVTDLEQMLVDIVNMTQMLKIEFQNLKASEWYMWKKRKDTSGETHEDMFAQLEKNLLDDIVKKIEVLKKIKKDIGHPDIV
ncbi:MAG: hypothetical protein ACREGI_00850 [Candidatus Levyibacteriota bacterium]